MREHHFRIPLALDATEAARPGDAVYLSGPLFTARPRWYRRILHEQLPPPVDIDALGANVLLHSGPLVRRTEEWWEMVAIVPMPDWLADAGEGNVARIIERLGLRAVIGKGRLDGLSGACARHQCLHLITLGTWNNFARQVERIVDVGWLDLGNPEAMWVFEAKEMGPFVVETDISGRSLYEENHAEHEARVKKLLEHHELDDFRYSSPDVPF